MHGELEPPIVGFDLDMTLTDPRQGALAAWSALEAELCAGIHPQWVVDKLGPPLEDVLSRWLPAAVIEKAAWRYRALFEELGISASKAMPGAKAAVEAVHGFGGKVIVVTAKWERHARAELDAVGISTDAVIGWRYGIAKGETLREYGAHFYVGDHPADIAAAKFAQVFGIMVATGPASFDELTAAGADEVLKSLWEFPRSV